MQEGPQKVKVYPRTWSKSKSERLLLRLVLHLDLDLDLSQWVMCVLEPGTACDWCWVLECIWAVSGAWTSSL